MFCSGPTSLSRHQMRFDVGFLYCTTLISLSENISSRERVLLASVVI